MNFTRLTTADHPLFDRAMALYMQSFPLHEQRAMDDQIRALSHPAYHFDLVLDGEELIGLALSWQPQDFVYIEHLCTQPTLRGKGYGMQILAQLAQLGKRIVLEIDPPEDDISIRRRGFYERAGYQVNDYPYFHPAYRKDCPRHRLVILSLPQLLSNAEYTAFCEYMRDIIMQYAQKKDTV